MPGAVCCFVLQLFHPDKFQEYVLGQRGSDTMVQAPKQLAFTDFYMPATAELVKDVFAEESTGVITQGLTQEGGYTAFGEQGVWCGCVRQCQIVKLCCRNFCPGRTAVS